MRPATDPPGPATVRIAVVGPCASGKSTLVENLRSRGYEAWVTAQEHSVVPGLWNHQQPDLLVALRTDLDTIRARRGQQWPEAIYTAQQQRLEEAYRAADLVIDTGSVPEDQTLELVLAYLQRTRAMPEQF